MLISAPQIIALEAPSSGSVRNSVTTSTKIELRSETSDTDVYYTIDGSKPDPYSRTSKSTKKFSAPISLPTGKIVVKAIAVSKKQPRESHITNKEFLVKADKAFLDAERRKKASKPGPLAAKALEQLSAAEEYSDPKTNAEASIAVSRLMCSACYAPRTNLRATFCPNCGSLYSVNSAEKPVTGEKPTENVVVEDQLDFQDNYALQCETCKALNDQMAESCTVCDAPLPLETVKVNEVEKPALKPHISAENGRTSSVKCKCGLSNSREANFCSRCGNQLKSKVQQCPICQNPIKADGKFCSNCGSLLATSSPRAESNRNTSAQAGRKSRIVRRSTFTKPISAGRGLWRSQIDHIATLLKQYASNHDEFRQHIANVRLGQIYGVILDYSPPDSLTVSVTVQVTDGANVPVDHVPRPLTRNIRRAEKRSIFSSAGENSVENVESKQAKPIARNRSEPRPDTSQSLSRTRNRKVVSDARRRSATITDQSSGLLKALQMPEQDVEEIKRLLQERADPNVKDSKNVPALQLAVRHGFAEAIQPMVDAGADVNMKIPHTRSTLLHEAVALGTVGAPTVSALLRAGADANAVNGREETAYELALRTRNTEAADILASHQTWKLLKKAVDASGAKIQEK